MICFSIGASMYYIAFYQHRLVPLWLSGWGLVSLTLAAIFSLLVMIGIIPSFGTIQVVANLSICTRNGFRRLADRKGDQSIGGRFRGCENRNE